MYCNRLPLVGGDRLSIHIIRRLQSTHSTLQIKAYCDLLGVPIQASEAKIKQAFYKKSLIHHPDRNPGNESSARLFGEINEAYQALLLNRREHQTVTGQDFSNRWKFKSNTFRQWHKPTEKSKRTQSTSWQGVNSETSTKASEKFTLTSADMYDTWYGNFYKEMVANDFKRHKELQRKRDAHPERGGGGCVVM